MKALRIVLTILLVFLIFMMGFVLVWKGMISIIDKVAIELPKLEKGVGDFLAQEIEKKISTPPPLKITEEPKEEPGQAPETALTAAGVVKQTNAQRAKYGLPPLSENAKLGASAKLKVEDMFNNQYFAHNSPSGATISDLVAGSGYQYITIGENLAQGNFKDDADLVQAWMDSPGHRENILNSKYREIGVAVAKGIFEGKTTWMAVQHFGLPLSVCPVPNGAIKLEIESDRDSIKILESRLQELLAEIEQMRRNDPRSNEKVEEYNKVVLDYNKLVGEIKILIDQYNTQIKNYNTCLIANQ